MVNIDFFLSNTSQTINNLELKPKIITKAKNGNEIKEYKTSSQLISHLKNASKNPLEFTNEEEVQAKELFKAVNYYSFSIYRKLLIEKTSNEKHSFSDCYDIYDFDNYLRQNINQFTRKIELLVKSSFTNSICYNYKGEYFKAECYLDPTLYTTYQHYREAINLMESKVSDSKSLYMNHHRKNKNNKFPLWVLVEELTFGEMTYLIEGFKENIRDQWKDFLIENIEFDNGMLEKNFVSKITSWVSSSLYIRNICAHHSRLYGAFLDIRRPSFWTKDMRNLKTHGIKKDNNATVFAHLLAIKNLLCLIDVDAQKEWNDFMTNIQCKINSSDNLHENHLGFIDNWQEFLIIN